MLYDGLGCLILSPFIWREGGVMGQDCPSFIWRTTTAISYSDLPSPESLEG